MLVRKEILIFIMVVTAATLALVVYAHADDLKCDPMQYNSETNTYHGSFDDCRHE